MIDFDRMFHFGIRVADLDKATAEMGGALGVRWATARDGEQSVWTPERGAETVPLRFTYSVDGPQHLELLEGAPGSPWHAAESPGVHHVGVWVDDVATETGRLVDLGWQLVAAQSSPQNGFGVWSYVAPPSGLIVELVDAAIEPHFQAWWAGSGG